MSARKIHSDHKRALWAIVVARRKFKSAGQRLMAKIKAEFPLGSPVRVQVSMDRVSHGTVAAHSWDPENPAYLVIKNSRTGKNHHFDITRCTRDDAFLGEPEERS